MFFRLKTQLRKEIAEEKMGKKKKRKLEDKSSDSVEAKFIKAEHGEQIAAQPREFDC